MFLPIYTFNDYTEYANVNLDKSSIVLKFWLFDHSRSTFTIRFLVCMVEIHLADRGSWFEHSAYVSLECYCHCVCACVWWHHNHLRLMCEHWVCYLKFSQLKPFVCALPCITAEIKQNFTRSVDWLERWIDTDIRNVYNIYPIFWHIRMSGLFT